MAQYLIRKGKFSNELAKFEDSDYPTLAARRGAGSAPGAARGMPMYLVKHGKQGAYARAAAARARALD